MAIEFLNYVKNYSNVDGFPDTIPIVFKNREGVPISYYGDNPINSVTMEGAENAWGDTNIEYALTELLTYDDMGEPDPGYYTKYVYFYRFKLGSGTNEKWMAYYAYARLQSASGTTSGYEWQIYPTLAINDNFDFSQPTNYRQLYQTDFPVYLYDSQYGAGNNQVYALGARFLYIDFANSTYFPSWTSETANLVFSVGGLSTAQVSFSVAPPYQLVMTAEHNTVTDWTVWGLDPANYVNYAQITATKSGDVVSMQYLDDTYGVGLPSEVYEDFSPEAGDSSEPGGMGQDGDDPSFDDSSDTIDLPTEPQIGVTNVGFVHVYKTGSQSLQDIGVELFPPLNYTPPTSISSGSTTDAIVDGFNAIVTFLANIPSFFEQSVAATLINYIIDCHVIPVTPSTGSSPEFVKVGYKQLTAAAYPVTSDYVDFDCGTINLAEFYANFADFLTSAKLYLPFVGFVPARPEWFYRDSLNVTYRFNVIDGSFMAFVRSTGKYVNNNNSGPTIVAQYSGNACVHLPITGVTYASMVSGLVGAGAGAVSSAGSGNIAGAATSALNAANLHGDMPQSNAYSSSGAFLGTRRPFLMIERPVSSYSKTYQRELGIPSNISRTLSSVSGFAIVGDIHLDGIIATDQEKAELEKLLSRGVIF